MTEGDLEEEGISAMLTNVSYYLCQIRSQFSMVVATI